MSARKRSPRQEATDLRDPRALVGLPLVEHLIQPVLHVLFPALLAGALHGRGRATPEMVKPRAIKISSTALTRSLRRRDQHRVRPHLELRASRGALSVAALALQREHRRRCAWPGVSST